MIVLHLRFLFLAIGIASMILFLLLWMVLRFVLVSITIWTVFLARWLWRSVT